MAHASKIVSKLKNPLAEVFASKACDGETARFRGEIAYDGTDFCGWQSQPSGKSVQDFVEKRLKAIFKKDIRLHASGRTDAGVHADAQTFHFDAVWKHSTAALLSALRSNHSDDVRILCLKKTDKEFHARYSVKSKRYVYRIYEGWAPPKIARYRWSFTGGKLNVAKMNAAAKLLVGSHDFTAFSAAHSSDDGNSRENPVKNLVVLRVRREGRDVVITTRASGYMYKMVRMLTGALVAVGSGRMQPAELKQILDSKRRGNFFQGAPAKGLTLQKVFY